MRTTPEHSDLDTPEERAASAGRDLGAQARTVNRQLWTVVFIFAIVNATMLFIGALFIGYTLDKQNQTLDALTAASNRSDCRSVLTGRSDLEFRDNLTSVFVALLSPDPATRTADFNAAVHQLDQAAPLTQHEIDKHCGPRPGT